MRFVSSEISIWQQHREEPGGGVSQKTNQKTIVNVLARNITLPNKAV